jgi:hypothetical protein
MDNPLQPGDRGGEMNQYEMQDAIEEIATLERRRGRLMERALFSQEPMRTHYYEWADAAADEIGRRQAKLNEARYHLALENTARGGLPL